ncbi:uroporphyrinogen-III synthase [Pararhizobium sp. LjRoot238]|uniref:uroporphyrinogen-III synthase n=1 Tax=Pararhizobium sp. LjRoot238 TaxID=3342293 RepID=UPI003ECEEF6C
MRILVTRPQPSAAATAARLEALGHEAIVLPMMEAVHLPQAAMDVLALPHSAIAVTSSETFRALSAIRDQLTPHLQTPVFCVGAATADAARQLGFQSVIVGPGTGAGLAHFIASTPTNLEEGLVYLAGVPRSPGFETALQGARIRCRLAEVYRMSPIVHAPKTIENLLLSRKPEAVLFYSHETARHFFALNALATKTAFHDMRLLCLSEHVAEAVPRGIGHIAIAAEPNEASLFALL